MEAYDGIFGKGFEVVEVFPKRSILCHLPLRHIFPQLININFCASNINIFLKELFDCFVSDEFGGVPVEGLNTIINILFSIMWP